MLLFEFFKACHASCGSLLLPHYSLLLFKALIHLFKIAMNNRLMCFGSPALSLRTAPV